MKLLKKRPIAILIMITAMLLSIFIGGGRSLAAERSRIEDYFFTSPESDGYSIQSDLEYIGATANNLKTVALRYLDADSAYIVQLNETRTTLDNAQTVSEKYEAVTALYGVVTALYEHLKPEVYSMNSTDKSFRSSLYDDISAAMQRIAENDYNNQASEFNTMLEDFFTGTIASFTGISPISIFG